MTTEKALREALDTLVAIVGLTAFKYEGQRKPLQEAIDNARAALSLPETAGKPVGIVTVGPFDHGPFTFEETAYGADHLSDGEHKLYAAPPSQPAQGWKLVPVEPTPEMWDAAWNSIVLPYRAKLSMHEIKTLFDLFHKAMLAAAPAAYATARPDDTIGSLERECSDLIDQVIQQRALIEGLAAMCRRMSYALKRQGANDTLVMQCVALLKKHDLGGNVVRAADTQPTAPAAPTQEPVLDKPASIGSTRFGKGVKVSTVIAAAQRLYEYQIRDEPDFAALMQAKPTNGEGA